MRGKQLPEDFKILTVASCARPPCPVRSALAQLDRRRAQNQTIPLTTPPSRAPTPSRQASRMMVQIMPAANALMAYSPTLALCWYLSSSARNIGNETKK